MQLVAFQILQIAQRNKKQHYRLNGLLMDLMDSASAVSNGTSKEEKFPPHRDSWEKVNWRHQGTLLLCKRTPWQDLKPLEKSLNFQGLLTEPCPCHRLLRYHSTTKPHGALSSLIRAIWLSPLWPVRRDCRNWSWKSAAILRGWLVLDGELFCSDQKQDKG